MRGRGSYIDCKDCGWIDLIILHMPSCPLPHVVTMIKIYMYSSLLSTLNIVEMKLLNINGRVGESVEIKCSDWGSWTNVHYNDKYFCKSPCTEDKHIIVKAAFGKSNSKGRIQLINIAEGFFVTFTNLLKSDSGIYYCGAERTVHDSFIKVNLKVTDAETSRPKTTPEIIIIHSTPSYAVTNSSTMSSDGSDVITDTSVSYTIHSTTTSATQGAGNVPHLITGTTVILTILMVLLMIMRKMRKKHLRVEEDARADVEFDEIRPEHQQTVSRPAWVSTLYDSVNAESLYANCSYHQDIELPAERGACAESRVTDPQCDLVYSVAQLTKEQIEPTGQSESNQSNENDCLYSMAQLPQAS